VSSASPVVGEGEAWRESIDSGALSPPRRSRGSDRSGSSPSEASCSAKELAEIKTGGPEPERHGRYEMDWGGETGLLVLAPMSDHGITDGGIS